MCGSCRRTKITWGASPLFLIKIHDVQIDLEDREVSCHTCKNIILITEEGVITKENLNLIDKYLLPFKKQIKGWF